MSPKHPYFVTNLIVIGSVMPAERVVNNLNGLIILEIALAINSATQCHNQSLNNKTVPDGLIVLHLVFPVPDGD